MRQSYEIKRDVQVANMNDAHLSFARALQFAAFADATQDPDRRIKMAAETIAPLYAEQAHTFIYYEEARKRLFTALREVFPEEFIQ